MRSSEFMDKQILELSGSKINDSFSFFSTDEDSEDDFEDDPSSYGFHPHRLLVPSHSSILMNCSSMDHIDSVKIPHEKVRMALVSEIDQTMKEYFGKLLHSVDDLSTRLSQLESKTCQLENSVDDLKVCAEYDSGRTDGKLRQLENILREVRDGIHVLRDKHEIAETQLQLAKLQGSKSNRQLEDHSTAVPTDSPLQASSCASEQSPHHVSISGALSLGLRTLPNAPSTLLYQNATPTVPPVAAQFPNPIPQNPISFAPQPESYHEQYNVLPNQQAQPPTPVPQLYQPAPNFPPVSQSIELPQLHPPLGAVNHQNQLSWTHYLEETPHIPSYNYASSVVQSSSLPPGGSAIHQFYADSAQQMLGQPSMRPNSEFRPANFSNSHSGSSSHHRSSTFEPSQLSPSSSVPGGGGNYSQLPRARILPHALPTATSVETGSGGTRNKVPIDDVVDKVTAMGFRRDLVKATVKRMTENGQSVDLNVVLDKLMNNDAGGHVQKGQFGR